jgi:hypothetical protein
VVLGWRGAWQLSPDTRQWFESRFTRRLPRAGEPGMDLWERNIP